MHRLIANGRARVQKNAEWFRIAKRNSGAIPAESSEHLKDEPSSSPRE
jgi:hypothetical protein